MAQSPPVSPPELDREIPECPYVGLVPFDESDAPYFFGRQRESEVVVANLTASRLTLFYAASGVGKSSVLRAGVQPRLQRIARESYEDLGDPDAAVVYVREWSQAPLVTIAAAVLDAVSRVPGADPVEATGSPRLSVLWLRKVLQGSGIAAIYLILDQFEEYFLYHPDDRGEEGLAAELGSILNTPDLPVNVLLSIREDALATLDRFKGRVPHLYDNYLRLAHLGRNAAQAAIEGPLDHYNQVVSPDCTMTVEPELTGTLLDQVRTGRLVVAPEGAAARRDGDGREDIETPYLQLVLTRLWEAERARGSSVLRRSTLDELGGAQTIVQNHLHTVMAGLSSEQIEVAAAVFHYLVTTSGSKIALTAETLADWSGVPVSSVRELLQSLSAGRQRILRPVPPPAGVAGPPRYEIFHDVMGAAVLEWRRQHIARREQDEASRKLVAEREVAQAEAEATRQRLRQTRLVALLAVGLVVVLLIAGVVGVVFYREVEQQTLLAEASASLGDNPLLSLRKAVEARQVNDDEDVREMILTVASPPRSRVIAGSVGEHSEGIVITPDKRRVVTYDALGGIRVLGEDGRPQGTAKASNLTGTVVAAATSPSASHVALATNQGSAAVIDVETGTQVGLTTDGSPLFAASWLDSSPDDLVLLETAESAATYSAQTGQPVARFPGNVQATLPIADAHVVTSDKDSRLRVWDARTAEKVAESSPLPRPAYHLQRFGHEVVGAAWDKIIRWDWRTTPTPREYPLDYLGDISQVAVSEATRTVTIAAEKDVVSYSLDDGSLDRYLPEQPGRIHGVALDPRDRWIATAGTDGRLRVWSGEHRQSIPNRATYELIAHRGGIRDVSYLRDGNSVVSLGFDGTVRLWDVPQTQRFDPHKSWVVDLDMSADGQWLATAGVDGNVHVVDLAGASNVPVATIPVGTRVEYVKFDPIDPHRIVTLGEYENQPKQWHWENGQTEQLPAFDAPLLGPHDYLVSLDISRDGKRLAAGDNHGNIYLWDASTGKLADDRGLSGSGQARDSIAFDPSGTTLAAADRDGILLKKLDAEEEPQLLPLPNAATVAFDPRGERIVGGTQGGDLRIWTRDGQFVNDLVARGSTTGSPSFSDDGDLLVVGTADGLIEVRNVRSGRTVMRVRHHGDLVNKVLFFPGDRSRMISASDDSTVAVSRCDACVDPDAVVREAERWVRDSN